MNDDERARIAARVKDNVMRVAMACCGFAFVALSILVAEFDVGRRATVMFSEAIFVVIAFALARQWRNDVETALTLFVPQERMTEEWNRAIAECERAERERSAFLEDCADLHEMPSPKLLDKRGFTAAQQRVDRARARRTAIRVFAERWGYDLPPFRPEDLL